MTEGCLVLDTVTPCARPNGTVALRLSPKAGCTGDPVVAIVIVRPI
jgi:hypothetical protein